MAEKKKTTVKVEEEDGKVEVTEETSTEEAEVDVEELPGGGTRTTVRPSRRYSQGG